MRNSLDDDDATTGLGSQSQEEAPSIESTAVEEEDLCRSAALRYEEDGNSAANSLVAKALENDRPTYFDCNICLEVSCDPVVTSCGHLFCWSCLYLWLHVDSELSVCPVCEAEIKETDLIPVYCRQGSGEARRKQWEAELGLTLPPRPKAKRIESVRQSGHGGIEEVIRRLRNRATMLRQWIRNSPQTTTGSEETTQLGRIGVLQDQGIVGPSNAVGGARERPTAYDDFFRGNLQRVDDTELMDGGGLQSNGDGDGDGDGGGGVGGLRGRRRDSSILERILHHHDWFGWQRPVGVVHPRGSIPSPARVGTSIGAFHIRPMMTMSNGNFGQNRQFSESVSSNAAAMEAWGGGVDNFSELDSVGSPPPVERRERRRRGRRNIEALRYSDLMGDGILPASSRRRAS